MHGGLNRQSLLHDITQRLLECRRVRHLYRVPSKHDATRAGRHFIGRQLQSLALRGQFLRTQAQNRHGATAGNSFKGLGVEGLDQIRAQLRCNPDAGVDAVV